MSIRLFGRGINSLPEQVQQNAEDIQLLKKRLLYPFNLKGSYDNTIQYLKYDLVNFQGSSYIASQDNIGVPVSNINYWQLLVTKETN